jgi:hypothetical protein
MNTPTEFLKAITQEQKQPCTKRERLILNILFILCQNAAARFRSNKDIKSRLHLLESKMNDIHPDLN